MITEEEIKLVEKVKFWEEQEEVNVLLAERLVYLHHEIEQLTEELAYSRHEIEQLKVSKSKPTVKQNIIYISFAISVISLVFSVITILI